MGFVDKLKEVLQGEEDDFDDIYDEVPSVSAPLYRSDVSNFNRAEKSYSATSYKSIEKEDKYDKPERNKRQKSDKVVNIHTTAQLQVVLCMPEGYDEAASIADNLNAKRTVVLNLEGTNRDVARRLLDFISGAAYANNGKIKRVANSTYIVTPYNVDVMGDLIDELENTGMFM